MEDITLMPDTVMSVPGDNSFGIGSLGPVVLQGNATLQGFNSGSTADGVTNFNGGISGGPTSALTIGNTVRPINLTIGASSTYGGGTEMNGGNVTLIPLIDLAGDLTLSTSSATRVTSITEDGSPRKLIKAGTNQLDLEGPPSHSGGTEVLSGILFVEHAGALGSGPLTVGATSVNVTTGNTLTITTPVTGTGTFAKGDAGILAIAPSVDATARGSAITLANGGILRVQGIKNLGDASPITFDNGGVIEFPRDPDTNFAHPVSIAGHGRIHVDRAAGGSGTNGRHALGAINVSTTSGNSLTVTGANGYGLSAGGYTSAANSTLTNNAPAP